MPEKAVCRCGLKQFPKGAHPLTVAQLCHHSSVEELEDAKEGLYKKVQQYAGKFTIGELTDKPISEAMEHYTRVTALQDYGALTEQERMAIATGFFRTYETILQLMRVEILLQIRTGGTLPQ